MNQPLRILHIFRSPVGGIFRHVRDLARAQAANGHLVGIVCDSSTGGAHETRLFDEISPHLALGIHRTPIRRNVGFADIGAAWRNFRIISRLKPDVLHGHGAKGGTYARLFGTMLRLTGGRPARFYSPHGGSLHYCAQTFGGKLAFLAEYWLEHFATDSLFFVSDHEAKVYAAKIGAPTVPAHIVYNGLQPQEFEPVLTETDAADFLYFGMMRDLKGPDLFIEALAMAQARLDRPLTAVMVGEGDDLPKYQAQVSDLDLGRQVRFYSALPAREAFTLGHVLVVPSRAEAMPYVVLETLAAGLPLIATNVGGIPEVLGRDSTALAMPDAASITDKMVGAMREPESLRAALPSRQTLEDRFSAERMARDIEKVYLQVLTY